MEDDGSPLNNFGKGLKKLFGKSRRGSGEDLTEQEIMSMVNEGHEHGVLQESEAEMINNIFTLDQKEAKDIMIHRKQIMALDRRRCRRRWCRSVTWRIHVIRFIWMILTTLSVSYISKTF